MKIVMLCDLYDERLQYQENLLAKYYAKNGHAVTVIAGPCTDAFLFGANRFEKSAPRRELWDGNVRVVRLPYSLNLFNRLRRFGGVGQLLESEGPDFIFVHDIHLNLREAVAYKKAHAACRIVMDYHADSSNSARSWVSRIVLHRLVRKSFLDRYLNHIDRIFPVVPASAEFLHELYGIAHERMELLPLGADSDRVVQTMKQKHGKAIRRMLGIPVDAIVVFTGGKLSPLKETHLLVDAFLELSDPRLHLVIVGDGDLHGTDYVRDLRRKCAEVKAVHFTGWLDGSDVYRYMDACDFAVFPASQSVLWQQALAMGLPLIVGEASAHGHQDCSYLNLYDNVVMLPREQISARRIAAEMRLLLERPEELARRRAGARRVGEELLNYDRIVAFTLRSEGKN